MTPENFGNIKTAWQDVLSLFVGRGKRFTVEALSAASGVPVSSIYAIQRGEYAPRWGDGMALLYVLPRAATDMVLAPLGLTTRPIEGDPCNFSLIAELGRATAHFTDALEDGRIDHREEKMAIPLVREVVSTGSSWLAAHDKREGRAGVTALRKEGAVL